MRLFFTNFIILTLLIQVNLFSKGIAFDYLEAKPGPGDGIRNILSRFDLPETSEYIKKFKNLNSGKFTRRGGLILSKVYLVPIRVYEFNGKTIRSSIGNNDYDYAKSLEIYNDNMVSKGLKDNSYKTDKMLWVPEYSFGKVEPDILTTMDVPLFGANYREIKQLDNKLKGNVYYIISGHGGPDPGAQGEKDGNTLSEDEYAYDVCLRLSRRLMEHGAKVYIIVQDDNDGIRDVAYLNNSSDEHYFGNEAIDPDQKIRLRKRAEIVNVLYEKNKKTATQQFAVIIHVDSRVTKRRIDIFFYYKDGAEDGEALCNTLYSTVKEKYDLAQPGRGYTGSVSTRSLYMLRNLHPITSYIELGNIQNPLDQIRLIETNNRQAIANWLTDGLIRTAAKKE